MRMMRFHVHDTLVLRDLQFWKMRVNQRRSAGVGVHVKQRSISCRENQSGQ